MSYSLGNYWLIKVSTSEWNRLLKDNILLSQEPYNWLKQGDYIITYVKGSGKIKGVFQVTSDWRQINEEQPYAVETKPEAIGEVDYELISLELDFVRDKEMCWVYLIDNPGNFKSPIPPNDAATILDALEKGKEKP
ncbi:MAG: hypothetical protein DRJ31_01610 [Candidatus Methanomethylicota archaeon]|uniref:Uncharacterized protein n=1 Tax=Thermoproteota archaeon TaxID=2056631 RepID=A0A497F2M5_9CREN|nr:MAG: hypothetical protein DRJ31_01610 [Candidatus Verstraetearchaeota archaeon]RLE53591.1 MAG: hypothetical protein DRJ33_00610 [Candidatus Verstraetearchaeota archaeon]